MAEYRIDVRLPDHAPIVVVGCGGTGGFVAEGLCRLLDGSQHPLVLVDHDRVEAHNLRRQNFYTEDLGRYKSQALGERLARQYGRRVAYSIYPYRHDLLGPEAFTGGNYTLQHGLTIGCVDNAAARRAMADGARWGWWIDCGNGEHSGQVLIGSQNSTKQLENSFRADGTVTALPNPTMQRPELLVPATDETLPRDCAEAVAAGGQSPMINQAVATLALEFVRRFLGGSLTWLAAYLDLEAGTMSTVPATPQAVARITGLKVAQLVDKPKKGGKR